MKSILNVLFGTLLIGGVVLAAAAGMSSATAQNASAAPAATTATGQGGRHAWHHHGADPWRLYAKLGLTAEQETAMKSLVAASKPQRLALHQQMRANHLQLLQATPDSPNYNSVVAEVAQSNATLASQRTTQAEELRNQMYALLTPAQKAQLATLQAQWAAKAAARQSAQ